MCKGVHRRDHKCGAAPIPLLELLEVSRISIEIEAALR